jgi:hypothetical protein
MKLTEKYIKDLYDKLKKRATETFLHGENDDCLLYLKAAAHTAYTFYLGYKDDELEKLLNGISDKLNKQSSQGVNNENYCVFYDSFSLDNKGLTQQYIRAIVNAGWHVLYITEVSSNYKLSKNIISELEDYSLSKIVYVPKTLKGLSRSQYIYDIIYDFHPSRLFMHISPSAVYAVTAFYALPPEIKRFQINLTDHTFWIGSGCVDYSLEFRSFGAGITQEFRGINHNNIFLLPFYPIISESEFKGFPAQCKNKVVIFSGGAFYKIIDKENTYFKLVKYLLDKYEETVFIYAGSGDKTIFEKFILDNNYQNRLFLIGHRSDINEVFKNCDIYLNTYPFGGGLMCEFAAHNSKPILCYEPSNRNTLESYLCQIAKENITTHTFEEFECEACKLITDDRYRIEKGNAINKCVINKSQFDVLFIKTTAEEKTQIAVSTSELNNSLNISDKVEYENRTKEYNKNLVKIFGYKSIFIFPFIFFDVLGILFRQKFLNPYLIRHNN